MFISIPFQVDLHRRVPQNNSHTSGPRGHKYSVAHKPNCMPGTRHNPIRVWGNVKLALGSFIPRGIKVQIFKHQRERQSLYSFSPVTSAKLRCHLAVVASFAESRSPTEGLDAQPREKKGDPREKNKKGARTGTSGRRT